MNAPTPPPSDYSLVKVTDVEVIDAQPERIPMRDAASAAHTIDPDRVMARNPTARHMLSHPAHLIAHGFGSGLLKPAPGTWGTLFAWGSFVLLSRWLTPMHWAWVIGIGFIVGCWAAHYTGKSLNVADHSSIVWDEVIAFWLVLVFIPANVLAQAFAFVLFRAFDIIKPPPIRWLDRRYKNGIGVMLDDLMAAFYALLVYALWLRITG